MNHKKIKNPNLFKIVYKKLIFKINLKKNIIMLETFYQEWLAEIQIKILNNQEKLELFQRKIQ